MHDEDYLIVDPACEVNEKGTRDKNDGKEVVNNCDLPLDLELTERVEVDDETLPYAEEDWDCPEQTEIDKRVQPDFPFTMETRQGKRGKNKKKYNPYGEGTSKSETKSNSRRKEQSSLVKLGKNATMSSISPREEQPSSKAWGENCIRGSYTASCM